MRSSGTYNDHLPTIFELKTQFQSQFSIIKENISILFVGLFAALYIRGRVWGALSGITA